MEKVKKNKDSLVRAFSRYMLVAIIIAFLGSLILGNLFNFAQDWFVEMNEEKANGVGSDSIDKNSAVKNHLYNEDDELVMVYYKVVSWESSSKEVMYNFISSAQFVVIPAWVILCLFIASKCFYNKKLNSPLRELLKASEKISQNNLDFKINYNSLDEVGNLSSSFEIMRRTLEENNKEMWRQMEERKRLNAAFSHDLRTPLTVLKGQSELLEKYLASAKLTPEKALQSVFTMKSHIIRMEKYVDTMNRLQRLEDIPIERNNIDSMELKAKLDESLDALVQSSGRYLDIKMNNMLLANETLSVDLAIIQQVFDNILSNAIRYTTNKIIVSINKLKENLYISVLDDGNGFDESMILIGSKPFTSTGGEGHLGIGLYICKVLCEKHGGSLHFQNTEHGALVEVNFSMN